VSLRNRLSRLEKRSGDGGAEGVREFFGLVRKYGDDPEVGAAAKSFGELMEQAEAAQGHEMTPQEWSDERWKESWGLSEALKRLIRAVLVCEDRCAEGKGGDQ
jgi:hypothetical protein